ncbi:MAG: OmpH family outer membrane protein [Chitinophagales bacterium]|nr:OmpH family outer membrane protein [Chitinophagales bacterium]
MKIILNVLTALFLTAMTIPAQAQTLKLGHVNITKVLEAMPGYKAAEKKLQEFAMQLQETVGKMEKEYAQKVQDYYDQEKDMLPAIKEIKQREITDLESRIVKLQGSSEEQLGQKQVELLKPLEEQVMAAIKGVATDKGFSYIFDASVGSNLLYYPPTDDVTDMVKAKLGITQ